MRNEILTHFITCPVCGIFVLESEWDTHLLSHPPKVIENHQFERIANAIEHLAAVVERLIKRLEEDDGPIEYCTCDPSPNGFHFDGEGRRTCMVCGKPVRSLESTEPQSNQYYCECSAGARAGVFDYILAGTKYCGHCHKVIIE
jgi:hypothetical protein